jgi:hypothetical protein
MLVICRKENKRENGTSLQVAGGPRDEDQEDPQRVFFSLGEDEEPRTWTCVFSSFLTCEEGCMVLQEET